MGRARSDFEGGCGSVRGMRDTCAGEKGEGAGSGADGGGKNEKEDARLCRGTVALGGWSHG